MNRPVLLLAALMLAAAPLAAQNPLAVETYRLPNGLTVYLNEDRSRPEIFGAVAVNAGGKNDPADATGIAHYLEHMLFKGTEALGTTDFALERPHLDSITALYDQLGQTSDPEARQAIQAQINEQSTKAAAFSLGNEFDNLLQFIGSKGVNAFTSSDMTFYHNSFPPNQIRRWLDIYAHRFQKPVFRTFQSELEVVYEEKNISMDNFGTTIFETFGKHFYKQHPYGQQTILGTVEHLKNPSLRKMYEFFNTYYVPGNMALILTGDFSPAEVKPLIEATFGQLPPGEAPPFPEYPEAPFSGREEVNIRVAPVKIGVLGYRAVPSGHPDEPALDLCNYLLFNEAETGFLNRLVLDNQLTFAGGFPQAEKDHGASVFFYVTKLVGQSLPKAEKLVLAEIGKLREGAFTEAQLEAAKSEIIRSFEQQLENLTERGIAIGEAFVMGQRWEDVLAYPAQIQALTKAQVVAAAQRYYGDDFLAIHAGRGLPKKTKLDKPGFKPVLPAEGAESGYARRFKALPEQSYEPRYVNPETDFARLPIASGASLAVTPNPLNGLFSLEVRFEAGERLIPALEAAVPLIGYAGAGDSSQLALKSAFQRLGCSYSVGASREYLTVSLSGIESNLEPALQLLGLLLRDPRASEDQLETVVNDAIAGRKLEEREPDARGRALQEYMLYGPESSYLRRYGAKELKALEPSALLAAFREALGYESQTYYAGKLPAAEVQALLRRHLPYPAAPKQHDAPQVRPVQSYTAPQVLLIDDKDAIQSQIYFYVQGDAYTPAQQAAVDAFNTYFGGGFSGLMLQEVREYRALAYSAGGAYRTPLRPGHPGYLSAYVGCQSDKTLEALEVVSGLIRALPEKRERMDLIRNSLIQEVYSNRPEFRDMAQTWDAWMLKGFTEDPNRSKYQAYQSMQFDDLLGFWRSQIQGRPLVITVLGDARRFDKAALAAYGQVVELELDDIIKK
ncbi:MAG: insulinase family protein [Bacteroidia bacterium]|nr:insulinase family protein [Bacteroidia bacterium]